MEPLRVAYFSDCLPPLTDGVARTLSQLAQTLLTERVDFRFFSGVVPEEHLPWRDRVHVTPSVPFPPYPYYRLGIPVSGALDPILDDFSPDLLHVVSPSFLGLYGVLYARSRKLPVVTSFHTDFVSYFPHYGVEHLQWLGWRYLTWFSNQCVSTYAPSRTTAAELKRRGVRGVELWERGVDHQEFGPSFRDPHLRGMVPGEGPLLLFVGRLVREKNLALLAEAVRLMERRGFAFRLAVVGDGPMRRELQALMPNAYFAGCQTGQALSRWYASADLFVFPSTTETFGNVILEALASGVPAVGAARGGVRDLIVPGVNGLLADPDSAADFARQVQWLLTRPAEMARMGVGARKTAARRHWAVVNRGLIASYCRILGRVDAPVALTA